MTSTISARTILAREAPVGLVREVLLLLSSRKLGGGESVWSVSLRVLDLRGGGGKLNQDECSQLVCDVTLAWHKRQPHTLTDSLARSHRLGGASVHLAHTQNSCSRAKQTSCLSPTQLFSLALRHFQRSPKTVLQLLKISLFGQKTHTHTSYPNTIPKSSSPFLFQQLLSLSHQ